ncbi:haloacid dehalogenase-like hydrolase family protein [Mycobacterium ulcerans str. Harvey]|uniref:Haloacid dehalogenase-like hydrolase family protein n=1 Tax=Mycobacterium ulcerans str. Harvey TaxID=1299332 RepID=A0ABP3A4R3_MYCUL|nr:haloacid dehalogenase-like hydrolase family protein [Mycobacterium ulcerans str. Harvey]
MRRATLRQAVADGVAIAVAAVPEGLPLVATLSQLAAAQRLTAHGALVRAPRTIEALGRVDTVCFDKTGTLTENRLRVVCAIPSSTSPLDPFIDSADPRSTEVLRAAARATTQPHDGQGHAHATDEAIIVAANSLEGLNDSAWTVIAEVPFESSRGYAASIGTTGTSNGHPTLMLKGAPETILPAAGSRTPTPTSNMRKPWCTASPNAGCGYWRSPSAPGNMTRPTMTTPTPTQSMRRPTTWNCSAMSAWPTPRARRRDH